MMYSSDRFNEDWARLFIDGDVQAVTIQPSLEFAVRTSLRDVPQIELSGYDLVTMDSYLHLHFENPMNGRTVSVHVYGVQQSRSVYPAWWHLFYRGIVSYLGLSSTPMRWNGISLEVTQVMMARGRKARWN